MKLMIVDDEQLTREGVARSVDWESLGVSQVQTASDGIFGLKLARAFRPDIVLSDVRMPRMDGIQMAMELRKTQPDCVILFMSGYSDKEYLKSAIQLKAIDYVEKPLDLQELERAVQDAVNQIRLERQHTATREAGEQVSKAQLVLDLAAGDVPDARQRLRAFGLGGKREDLFAFVLLRLPQGGQGRMELERKVFLADFKAFARERGLGVLYAVKGSGELAVLLSLPKRQDPAALDACCRFIVQRLANVCPVQVAAGKAVTAPERACQSCRQAEELLEAAFYFAENHRVRPEEVAGEYVFPREAYGEFAALLKEEDGAAAQAFLSVLCEELKRHTATRVAYTKDVYQNLLYTLDAAARENYINFAYTEGQESTLLHSVAACWCLSQLDELLQGRVAAYFAHMRQHSQETGTIGMIKAYIESNLADSNLSIKTISDYINLSTSYTCTVFKNETGQTLNQFITNVRIERARQLIRDPRVKIADISAAVGYADSNYFAKAFKKSVGISPSEYRDKRLP